MALPAARSAGQAASSANCSNDSLPSSNAAAGPSVDSAVKPGKASMNSKHSPAPAGKGSHTPPGRSAWQQLGMLLFGFRQSGVEDSFLAYKYQETRTLDTCAAAYHAAVTLSLVISFPATTWLHWRTLLNPLGVMVGWALPAFVVMRVRPYLSPKGRELAVLMVDLILALQCFSIGHGFPAMPPAAHARMVLQNSIVDFLVPIIAFGILRATLSQARARLFTIPFGMYMATCMYCVIRRGVPVHLSVLRYGAVLLVAVVVSAALELQSRASFMQLSASREGALHGAGQLHGKQRRQQWQRQQQRPQPPSTQGAHSSFSLYRDEKAGNEAAQEYLEVLDQIQAPSCNTEHDVNASDGTQCSVAPVSAAAMQAVALRKLAMLFGPGFREQLAAASLAMPTGKGVSLALEYQSYCQMQQVGIKVHSEEHAMGTPGFKHMADMLTAVVCEAAGTLMAASSECSPCVRATCVQGCIQLLAGIHMASGALGSGRFPSSDGTRRALKASLQSLVHSRLQAMCGDQEAPDFKVIVTPCSSSNSSGSSSECGPSGGSTMGAPGAGRLRACNPPCLAAGAGSCQLELLLDVHGARSLAESRDGNTFPEVVVRLVIWGINGEVLVDSTQHLAQGQHAIRLCVDAPEKPGLLHMALLLGSHHLAFVQPLLVMPGAAATELQQLWGMATALATDKVHRECAEQKEVHQGPPSAAVAEAWQQITPLLMDIAYVLGCTAPLTTAAAAEGMLATGSSASAGQLAVAKAASLALPDAQPKPWLGGEASAAHQELMVHLMAGLFNAGLWATTDYVCSAAAASGRIVGSTSSQQEQLNRVAHQEEHAAQFEDDAPGGVAARAAAACMKRRGPSPGAKAAACIAAVLFYPLLLLVRQMQWGKPPHAGTALHTAASSSKTHASEGMAYDASLAMYVPRSLWRQLLTLLTGFKQPNLEQAFLAHRLQHLLTLDACAAIYHGLLIIAAAISYPAASWHQCSTQWGMACTVFGAGLPVLMAPVTLVPRLRALLGPRGRELLALGVDVAMALQAVAIACGLAALPEFVRGRFMAESGFKDEVMMQLALAVMRPMLSQARVKWFAMTFSLYCAASAWAAAAQGMPCSHAVWRYVRVAAIAITIAAAAELHARQVFLKLAGKGAVTVQGVGYARAGDAKKHV